MSIIWLIECSDCFRLGLPADDCSQHVTLQLIISNKQTGQQTAFWKNTAQMRDVNEREHVAVTVAQQRNATRRNANSHPHNKLHTQKHSSSYCIIFILLYISNIFFF